MNQFIDATEWITTPLTSILQQIGTALPLIVGALVLLVVGHYFGKILGAVLRKILEKVRIDSIVDRSGFHDLLGKIGVEMKISQMLGKFVYFVIFLCFLISAADLVGLSSVSQFVVEVVLYLPRMIAAVAVLIIGLMVATWAAQAVRRTADAAGLDYAPTLERVTQGIISFVIVLMALDQLQIRIGLVQEIVGILIIAVGAAVALSLGLGTRNLASEIVSGTYVRDLFQPGDQLEWEGTTASVKQVGTLKTILEMKDGRLLTLPNSQLINHQTIVRRG
ncbi:MAG: mechanosensitive ion channel [Candidatus Methylacidiphilales bacterium]